jgi:hypothetical protein
MIRYIASRRSRRSREFEDLARCCTSGTSSSRIRQSRWPRHRLKVTQNQQQPNNPRSVSMPQRSQRRQQAMRGGQQIRTSASAHAAPRPPSTPAASRADMRRGINQPLGDWVPWHSAPDGLAGGPPQARMTNSDRKSQRAPQASRCQQRRRADLPKSGRSRKAASQQAAIQPWLSPPVRQEPDDKIGRLDAQQLHDLAEVVNENEMAVARRRYGRHCRSTVDDYSRSPPRRLSAASAAPRRHH